MSTDSPGNHAGSPTRGAYLKTVILLAVIVAGTLLRVIALESAPLGLNQDETSTGYEAWAILNYGVDRNGFTLPVLLRSWGSGQNALYSYVAMPFIGALGLSVVSTRLPAAILGSVAIALAYLLGKRTRDERFGLILATVVAFNPWHLTISRWALESNLLPFMVLLAMYAASRWDAPNSRFAHIAVAIALGISLYAYGTAFIWAPLFAVGVAVRSLVRDRTLRLKQIGVAALVFSVIAFPIAWCNYRNVVGLSAVKLLWFTLPSLTETRQASTMNLDILENLRNLLRLLWTQDDGLPWNSVPGYGLFYGGGGLIVALLGIGAAAFTRRGGIALIALAGAIVTAAFIDANINRVNVLLVPILYFQAECLHFIASRVRGAIYAVMPLLVILGALTVGTYFRSVKEYPFGRDNMPYIYVLFDELVPPGDYHASVEFLNPGDAFEWPAYFNWRDESGEFHEWRLEQ
ncbi:MAG: phospholipid carrier-dependent glycosyltransferase [Oscillospiraceae bacterium]|nr:phospholipid carrier-dependent glycosyltransferase [Oscillospiraceae bacterium]